MSELQIDYENKFPVDRKNKGEYSQIHLAKEDGDWKPGWIAKTANRPTSDSSYHAWNSVEEFQAEWEKDFEGLRQYFLDYLPPFKIEYKEGHKYANNTVDVEQTMYMPEIVKTRPEDEKHLAQLDELFEKCIQMYKNYRAEFVHFLPDIKPANLIYGFNIDNPEKKQWFIIDLQPAIVMVATDRVKDRMVRFINQIIEKYDPEGKFEFKNAKKINTTFRKIIICP